jgi:hypothetical protein
MRKFDPIADIENSASILDNGAWPNFHDAIVYSINFWRGDVRPDEDIWVFPTIEASLALDALILPYVVDLRFHGCDDISMQRFDHNADIYWLSFEFEDRGYFADGVTPLPPWIRVTFERGPGAAPLLQFTCFRVEAVGRRAVPEAPCR